MRERKREMLEKTVGHQAPARAAKSIAPRSMAIAVNQSRETGYLDAVEPKSMSTLQPDTVAE
jgi:hypothetical protein